MVKVIDARFYNWSKRWAPMIFMIEMMKLWCVEMVGQFGCEWWKIKVMVLSISFFEWMNIEKAFVDAIMSFFFLELSDCPLIYRRTCKGFSFANSEACGYQMNWLIGMEVLESRRQPTLDRVSLIVWRNATFTTRRKT